jgi:hypothetical protein
MLTVIGDAAAVAPAHDLPYRGKFWAKHKNRMVIVERLGPGEISVQRGTVCSFPGSHLIADNTTKTILWMDEVQNQWADNGDDAHEKGCMVHDRNLLKLDEARLLTVPGMAQVWFEGMYSESEIEQIVLKLIEMLPPEGN